MKRVYIWIICCVIGVSFLSLLYLQSRYADAVIRMRKDQFDENVFRSLDQASRDLEKAETYRYLQTVMKQREKELAESIEQDTMSVAEKLDTLLNDADLQIQILRMHSAHSPQTITKPRNNHMSLTLSQLQKHVQKAYVYESDVLEEVIYAVMYQASDLRFQDRLDPAMLDNFLRSALEGNGVTMPFHFIVYTSDGREVFRCPDYDVTGQEYSYTQTLFRSDPTGNMGFVSIHFPDQKEYILGVANFVAPAMLFTVILFVTFIFTVYLAVRQKKVSEMKNDFVHNMTHEFKTPISTISIAAQMLADKSVPKNEGTYERLGSVINTETKRLRFQVEKVLQMSLFDHNNIALKLSELDANDLIDNVVQTFSIKVSQSGGTLDTHLQAENPYVNVDEMHFTNIIFNLLDNAFKYRRDDAPLRLEVSTWNQGDNICISVKDNGVGIQKDDLKRIFDKFYRVHTGNQHNVKGFGLGLTYVKKMVELHHGSTKVCSEVGNGTRFIITLRTVKD